MAKAKYAHLRGQIPQADEQPSAKDEALVRNLQEREQHTIDQLTLDYVATSQEIVQIAEDLKPLQSKLKACEILIMRYVKGQALDGIRANGFNWGENFTPYPVCEDPEAIVQYFKDHDMEAQLALTKTELASRLDDIVKNEALNNELRVEVTEEPDPATGEMKEVRNVYSNVTGVRVFLKSRLSKTKA